MSRAVRSRGVGSVARVVLCVLTAVVFSAIVLSMSCAGSAPPINAGAFENANLPVGKGDTVLEEFNLMVDIDEFESEEGIEAYMKNCGLKYSGGEERYAVKKVYEKALRQWMKTYPENEVFIRDATGECVYNGKEQIREKRGRVEMPGVGTTIGLIKYTAYVVEMRLKFKVVHRQATQGQATTEAQSVSTTQEQGTADMSSVPTSATTFTDDRDKKTYKKVTIGTQTWMAENLNYETMEGSKCYGNSEDNCVKYGRLYSWKAALGACPDGWHLPSGGEWEALENTVGGSSTAGMKLKSKTGWNENGNGTDNYKFSALPGGLFGDGSDDFLGTAGEVGEFGDIGFYAMWWTASPSRDGFNAWYRGMNSNYNGVGKDASGRKNLYSVRCVQND